MEHDRSNRDRVSADYVEKLRETDRYLDALSASMSTDHASAEHNDSAEYDDVAPELTSPVSYTHLTLPTSRLV